MLTEVHQTKIKEESGEHTKTKSISRQNSLDSAFISKQDRSDTSSGKTSIDSEGFSRNRKEDLRQKLRFLKTQDQNNMSVLKRTQDASDYVIQVPLKKSCCSKLCQ